METSKINVGQVIALTGLAKFEARYATRRLSINDLRATAKFNLQRNRRITAPIQTQRLNALECRLLTAALGTRFQASQTQGRLTLHLGNK